MDEVSDPGKQDYDPRTRDWYKELLKAPGKAIVSDPLISATTKNVVVIAGITLPDGKGAIGVDLSLSKLNEIVKEVKLAQKVTLTRWIERINIWRIQLAN